MRPWMRQASPLTTRSISSGVLPQNGMRAFIGVPGSAST